MTPAAVTPKKKCFVISPIGKEGSPERKTADQVLKHLVRKSLGHEFDVERADESINPGSITPAMISAIEGADLIIADLSGFNPNVFYEVAIAHGYQKPTVHLQTVSERPPFDVKDVRIVKYDLADPDQLESAQKSLSDFAKYALANPGKVETPLSAAHKFSAVQESTDPTAESNVLVLDAIEQLRREVRQGTRRRAIPVSAELGPARADNSSCRLIIERALADERLSADDFDSVITNNTSVGFDAWAQKCLAQIMADDDEYALLDILNSDEVGDPREGDEGEADEVK